MYVDVKNTIVVALYRNSYERNVQKIRRNFGFFLKDPILNATFIGIKKFKFMRRFFQNVVICLLMYFNAF